MIKPEKDAPRHSDCDVDSSAIKRLLISAFRFCRSAV